MRTYYLFVPGIFTPLSNDTWDAIAAQQVNESAAGDADTFGDHFPYHGDLTSALVGHASRVAKCADVLRQASLAYERIVVAAHSYGGRIVCDALKLDTLGTTGKPPVRIDSLHLIAAAADSDCQRNGLNDAYVAGRAGEVVVYVSARDEALSAAQALFVLGFGDLGKVGPKHAALPIEIIRRDSYGHTDWVGGAFAETFARITQAPAAPDQEPSRA